MNRKEYSAGAVKHSFWFMEFRKVVSLRLEGKTWEEIKRLTSEFCFSLVPRSPEEYGWAK